jgi:long-chain acyl-CoA synthetase
LNAGHSGDTKEMARSPQVFEQIKNAVSRVNSQLPPFEQIRKFRILDRDFTIEDGEMTPTMKVRRNRVLENFRTEVSEMYAGKEESQ